jgi:DNA-binding response OmpR family regulator
MPGGAHPLGIVPTTLPPRILLVMPAQWPRALLRAALREVGYDASGTRALKAALSQAAPDSARGQVRLVLLDQDALTEEDGRHLKALRARTSGVPIVLLAPVTRRVREGPWTRVIRRPISIAALVQAIETLIPLAPQARRPID